MEVVGGRKAKAQEPVFRRGRGFLKNAKYILGGFKKTNFVCIEPSAMGVLSFNIFVC